MASYHDMEVSINLVAPGRKALTENGAPRKIDFDTSHSTASVVPGLDAQTQVKKLTKAKALAEQELAGAKDALAASKPPPLGHPTYLSAQKSHAAKKSVVDLAASKNSALEQTLKIWQAGASKEADSSPSAPLATWAKVEKLMVADKAASKAAATNTRMAAITPPKGFPIYSEAHQAKKRHALDVQRAEMTHIQLETALAEWKRGGQPETSAPAVDPKDAKKEAVEREKAEKEALKAWVVWPKKDAVKVAAQEKPGKEAMEKEKESAKVAAQEKPGKEAMEREKESVKVAAEEKTATEKAVKEAAKQGEASGTVDNAGHIAHTKAVTFCPQKCALHFTMFAPVPLPPQAATEKAAKEAAKQGGASGDADNAGQIAYTKVELKDGFCVGQGPKGGLPGAATKKKRVKKMALMAATSKQVALKQKLEALQETKASMTVRSFTLLCVPAPEDHGERHRGFTAACFQETA
eukprot:gene14911-20961_t